MIDQYSHSQGNYIMTYIPISYAISVPISYAIAVPISYALHTVHSSPHYLQKLQ